MVNIDDTTFAVSNDVVLLNGPLVNKTEPGIVWFYISGTKPCTMPQSNSNLLLKKRIAGLWANGRLIDSDFFAVMQNMTSQHASFGEQIGTPQIP